MEFHVKADWAERRHFMQDSRFNDTGRCIWCQNFGRSWPRRIADAIGEPTFDDVDQRPDVSLCAVGLK